MNLQNDASSSLPTGTTLFRFNGVPVVAQTGFWLILILATSVLAWIAGRQNPMRSWSRRLDVTILALPLALFAEIGHALAHTISARMAGAPMDEILLPFGMTRTLYRNSAVPPRVHIQRSLGGPIFSLIFFSYSV